MAQLKGKYIEDATIALAKNADMATYSFIGRTTAGTGVQEVLSKAEALAVLNVTDGATPTNAANVNSAGAVMETDYDANTMMIATSDDTPVASTATQVRTFVNVEDGADVTDEANVTDALDGATLATATVATNDKILIQDTDGTDVLKTVTVQSIVDLADVSGENKAVEILPIPSGDITAKYYDLTQIPATATAVQVTPVGGIAQEYTVDYTVITDGADIKRFNWDGLGLEALLEADDKVMVSYTY